MRFAPAGSRRRRQSWWSMQTPPRSTSSRRPSRSPIRTAGRARQRSTPARRRSCKPEPHRRRSAAQYRPVARKCPALADLLHTLGDRHENDPAVDNAHDQQRRRRLSVSPAHQRLSPARPVRHRRDYAAGQRFKLSVLFKTRLLGAQTCVLSMLLLVTLRVIPSAGTEKARCIAHSTQMWALTFPDRCQTTQQDALTAAPATVGEKRHGPMSATARTPVRFRALPTTVTASSRVPAEARTSSSGPSPPPARGHRWRCPC